MEVVTKVACGSVIAGGGGAAGAYGVHRLSTAYEAKPEAPTPEEREKNIVSSKGTGDNAQTERNAAENTDRDNANGGEQDARRDQGAGTPGVDSAASIENPETAQKPEVPTQGENPRSVDGTPESGVSSDTDDQETVHYAEESHSSSGPSDVNSGSPSPQGDTGTRDQVADTSEGQPGAKGVQGTGEGTEESNKSQAAES